MAKVSQAATRAAERCAIEASKMIAPFVDLIREQRITEPIHESNSDIKFAEIIQEALEEVVASQPMSARLALDLFREQAVTISRSDYGVRVSCDDSQDADIVFRWLEQLASPSASKSLQP